MPPQPARVEELKKRYEENPRRFFAPLANEYRKAGDLAAAIDLCRMHLEEQPGHLSGHIVYGQALFESAQPDEAKRIFEAALTLDPENLIALRHLGDIAKGQGDAASAKHWYGRVLEADPRNDEVMALIESLSAAAPAPTVIVAEPHEPPPAPNYAEPVTEPTPIEVPASQAPTPVVPHPAVPAPAPRLSIGLMDLDLNLADSTAPAVDLLGGVGVPPAEPPTVPETAPTLEPMVDLDAVSPVEPPPTVEMLAPEVLEPIPAFDETVAAMSTSTDLGVDVDVGTSDVVMLSPEGAAGGELEIHDTSFDAPPLDESPTFAVAAESPAFGDALDVTAGIEVEPEPVLLVDGSSTVDTGDAVAIGEPVTEPRPIEPRPIEPVAAPDVIESSVEPTAAPAAATPADFDALFGNAPIADVTIGGDQDALGDAEAGFVADSFVGREPTDELLETAPDIQTPPSPFVTETMAELYLQQGFRDEALEVYRQLLAQNPDDAGLAERVRHLEHGTRSSLAIDSVSAEIEAAAEADAVRRSGSVPTVPPEPVLDAAPSAEVVAEPSAAPTTEPAPALAEVPVAEPVAEQVAEQVAEPAAPASVPVGQPPIAEPLTGPAPIIEMIPEPPPRGTPVMGVPATRAPAQPSGPTAREVFARIATRRALPGGGVSEPPSPASAPIAVSEGESEVPAAVPDEARSSAASAGIVLPEVAIASGGALDRVFDATGVQAQDEGAALMLAAAYGGVPAAPIKGQPTRRGSDELSLDAVFKDEVAARAATVQRQSTRLRFDQFFAGAEGGEAPPAPATPPPSPEAPADDIAQFTDWLKGLKNS